jgi:plastocyanin
MPSPRPANQPPADRRWQDGVVQRFGTAAVVMAALAAGLVGCGGDGESAPTTTINQGRETIPSAPVVKVTATNYKYSIAALRARPGEELTIALTSTKETHDFVLDDGKLPVRIAIASEGVTAVGGLTAPQTPGTYVIYCSLLGHRGEGMQAELIVAE